MNNCSNITTVQEHCNTLWCVALSVINRQRARSYHKIPLHNSPWRICTCVVSPAASLDLWENKQYHYSKLWRGQ